MTAMLAVTRSLILHYATKFTKAGYKTRLGGEKPVSYCKNHLVFCFEENRGKAVTPFISDMFHYNLEQKKIQTKKKLVDVAREKPVESSSTALLGAK